MAEATSQKMTGLIATLGNERTVRVVGYAAFVAMALFMVLRVGIMPAASAGDDLWYDESGYWLLNAGHLARAIHDNAAGDGLRDFLPPMTGTFTAASFALFGYSQFAVGIVPTASCALGGLLCALALRRRFDTSVGAALALTLVPFFTPFLLKIVGHNRFEAQVYLFFCAAMLAGAVPSGEPLSRWRALFAGVFTGLATIAYYPTGPLVVLALFAWTIVDARAWNRLAWFVGGGALVLAGFLAWIGTDFGLFLAQMQASSSRYVQSTPLFARETIAFFVPSLAGAAVLAASPSTRFYGLLTVAGILLRIASLGFAIAAVLPMMLGLATLVLQPQARARWSEAVSLAGRWLVIGLSAMVIAVTASGLAVSWSERADRNYAAFARNLRSVMPANRGGFVLFDRPAHLALRPLYGRPQLHHLVSADAQTAPSLVLDDPSQATRVEAVVYWPAGHASLTEIASTTPLLAAFLRRPYHAIWVSPRGVGQRYIRGGGPYEVMVLIPGS